MDGPRLAMKIRQEIEASRMPEKEHQTYICCVSAYEEANYENNALQAGMNQFATKPLSDANLLLILQRLPRSQEYWRNDCSIITYFKNLFMNL